MNRKILLMGLVVLAIACGYFRDHIFVSINSKIAYGSDIDGRLTSLKWMLTGVFCLVYFLITSACLYVAFGDKKYIMLAVFFYGFLLIGSVLIAAIGSLFSSFHAVYPLVRGVLGVMQSPIVMMVLLAAGFLTRRGVKV